MHAQFGLIINVNKDLSLKVKAITKDWTFNAKTRTKDSSFVLKDKLTTKDQGQGQNPSYSEIFNLRAVRDIVTAKYLFRKSVNMSSANYIDQNSNCKQPISACIEKTGRRPA